MYTRRTYQLTRELNEGYEEKALKFHPYLGAPFQVVPLFTTSFPGN